MGSKREDLKRGQQAKDLLNNPLYTEAFIKVRKELVNRLLNTEYEEANERDGYYMAIKAVELNEQYVESVLTTGKFAEHSEKG